MRNNKYQPSNEDQSMPRLKILDRKSDSQLISIEDIKAEEAGQYSEPNFDIDDALFIKKTSCFPQSKSEIIRSFQSMAPVQFMGHSRKESRANKKRDSTMTADSNRVEKENAKEVKKLVIRAKSRKLIEMYISKLRRNNLSGTNNLKKLPELQSINMKKEDKLIVGLRSMPQKLKHLQGCELSHTLFSILLFLDIGSTMAITLIAAFNIYFPQFRENDALSLTLVLINSIIIVITFLSLLERLFAKKILYSEARYLEQIKDLFLHQSKKFQFYGEVALLVLLLIEASKRENILIGVQIAILLLAIFKLFFLRKKLPKFETNSINTFHRQQYWSIFKLFIFDIFFAHLIAVVLFGTALTAQFNWIINFNLQGETWYIQYIWGYYWAITIMMTVGFGDITPAAFSEAIVVAFLQLFSVVILSYNISQIASIISNLRDHQEQLMHKMSSFHKMAKEDQIDSDLSRKVQIYIKQSTRIKQQSDYQQKKQLLQSLPPLLKKEYLAQANKKTFKRLSFFNTLQKDTLIELAKTFQNKDYYPGEYINPKYNFYQKKYEDNVPWITIMKQGEVGYAYWKRGSTNNGNILELVKISPNSSHDQQKQNIKRTDNLKNFQFVVNTTHLTNSQLLDTSFISRTRNLSYDMIAQSYSFVYTLAKDQFFKILKGSQMDFCHYFSVKHKHPLDENQHEFINCPYCPRQRHSCFYCPKLQYMPIRGALVLRSLNKDYSRLKRDRYFLRKKNQQFFKNNPLKLMKEFFDPIQSSVQQENLIMDKISSTTKNMSKNFMKYTSSLHKMVEYERYQRMQNTLLMSNEMKKYNVTKTQEILAKSIRHQIEKSQKNNSRKMCFFLDTRLKRQEEIQIDQMHNFVAYFPFQNPSHLIYFPLSVKIRTERKIAIFK